MKFNIITIFPEMFKGVFEFGVIKQGIKNDLLKIDIHNLRNFSTEKHGQVDDRPFGGGTGMVLMVEPLVNAIDQIKSEKSKVIYLSPKGIKLTQQLAENLSKEEELIIVCGRYEGIDQRFIDKFVDLEISIGDYVLSGAEFASMVLIDSVSRLVKGVIKNSDFNTSESFSNPTDRGMLDFPQYTRPFEFRGLKIPEVLISGNHKKIAEWRKSKQ